MKFSIKTFQQFRLNFWTLHLGTGEGENIKFISISNGTVSAQNKRTETKDERFCFDCRREFRRPTETGNSAEDTVLILRNRQV